MSLKLLDSHVVTGLRSGVAWASRIVERLIGEGFVTKRTASDSVVNQRPRVLWKDLQLGLDPDGGCSCLGDTLRDNLRGGLLTRIAGRMPFKALTSCAHRQGTGYGPTCRRR